MEADELVEVMAKAIWNSRDPARMLYFRWDGKHTLEEWKDTYRVAAQAALSALEAEGLSQTLTTDSEVIFGGVRIDPGTYQIIRRVDARVGEGRRTQPDDPVPAAD